MGVTACHTPFHTCFNRCKEPRRWGALRLFAFFVTQRSGVTKQSLPQPHGTKRYATFMRAVCYRRFFITKRSGVTRQSQLRSHGVKEMMQPACRTHLSSGYFYFIWLMSCNKRCFSSAESVIHCSRSCV